MNRGSWTAPALRGVGVLAVIVGGLWCIWFLGNVDGNVALLGLLFLIAALGILAASYALAAIVDHTIEIRRRLEGAAQGATGPPADAAGGRDGR